MMPSPNQTVIASPTVSVRDDSKLTSDQLVSFMNTHGISIQELSEILGVSNQAVRLWTSGQRDFSITNSKIVRLMMKKPHLIREF